RHRSLEAFRGPSLVVLARNKPMGCAWGGRAGLGRDKGLNRDSSLRRHPCYSDISGPSHGGSWRSLRGLSRRRSRVRVPSLPSLRLASSTTVLPEVGLGAFYGSGRRPTLIDALATSGRVGGDGRRRRCAQPVPPSGERPLVTPAGSSAISSRWASR